jgi:hypothetical protein
MDINKDLVRRVLAKHYRPMPDDNGPSWLTFIGHAKDSLWSIDLFRCESILLNTHWVLVVMDQFTRRIIGFGVHAADVDGVALCRMFNSSVYFVSRSMRRYALFKRKSSLTSVRLRATHFMNAPLGAVVTPAMCAERVERWMINNT